jgi:hypothetical protein
LGADAFFTAVARAAALAATGLIFAFEAGPLAGFAVFLISFFAATLLATDNSSQ